MACGGTGPLARYRLAPRRREMTFGRRSVSKFGAGENIVAIVRAGAPTDTGARPKPALYDSSGQTRPRGIAGGGRWITPEAATSES